MRGDGIPRSSLLVILGRCVSLGSSIDCERERFLEARVAVIGRRRKRDKLEREARGTNGKE